MNNEELKKKVEELKEDLINDIDLKKHKTIIEVKFDKHFGGEENQSPKELKASCVAWANVPADTRKGCGKRFMDEHGNKLICAKYDKSKGHLFKVDLLCPECQSPVEHRLTRESHSRIGFESQQDALRGSGEEVCERCWHKKCCHESVACKE